jgi:hypothetical protein
MKRTLFLLTMSLSLLAAKAQKLEDIKNQLIFNKYKEAKVEIDKGMSNPKFNNKAEAYMQKAVIYAALALEPANKNTPTGEQLMNDADAAFHKYMEMEPALTLVNDPIYQNGAINLYSNYYAAGYSDYADKKWQPGFEKLKKAVDYSDLLISKKLLKSTIDTNVLILAGITAENSNNKDAAVKYYGRLADNKIAGEGFESVYRFLVIYYFTKKDMASFEKYKGYGKQLFPKSEYFNYDKVDFAVGLIDNFNDKLKAVEEVLAADPNNMKANDLMWGLIYDTLNSNVEGAVLPANYDELERKMIVGINKTVAAKPDVETPYIFLGNHFIVKKDKIAEARQKHAEDMKARTKPGTMASKEDIAKRDLLDKQYLDAMDAIRDPYEKAAKIFAAKSTLDIRQKQQYRNIAGYLAEIYELKAKKAKPKSPEQAAFEAEEKKWGALYDTIK